MRSLSTCVGEGVADIGPGWCQSGACVQAKGGKAAADFPRVLGWGSMFTTLRGAHASLGSRVPDICGLVITRCYEHKFTAAASVNLVV